MEKWYVRTKKADFYKWAELFQISPVTARVLRNRDLTDEDEVRKFLRGTLQDCYSPWLMKDMDKAVDAVVSALEQHQRIRVIGDYDVDGICSAYLLDAGLQCLGAEADIAIPHRIHDGYGLNDHLIGMAKDDGIELIITCDNGIAAAEQIALAASLDIDVVVTDHHEVPFAEKDGVREELLPPALAVIDPKRSDCPYPFKGICGCVVAFKFMQALLETLQRDGGKKREACLRLEESMEEFLEFAAFATVCDVMELRDENRILVREGLKRMRESKNLGIRALIEVNGIEPAKLSSYHLGFVLGPCLNATGRLDTAKRALELLQSATKEEAMCAARDLTELNSSRKNMTLEGLEQAVSCITRQHMEADKVLVIFLPDVHESLAGIIAGRVREKYNRPTFILTRGEEGVKGSGRSIEAYHMYEAMTQVGELFTKFGGHKMAAGMSMEEENIEKLRLALNENCSLTDEDFITKVYIDVPMPISYADEALARELEALEPFGTGNSKPLFAQKDLIFLSGYRMGTGGSAARFRVRLPEGGTQQLVLFRGVDEFERFLDEKYGQGSAEALFAGQGSFAVSVVYQLGLNTYRGITEKQIIIQYYS